MKAEVLGSFRSRPSRVTAPSVTRLLGVARAVFVDARALRTRNICRSTPDAPAPPGKPEDDEYI